MRVLVTGGAGYLGSHTAITLLDAGFDVSVVDDLSGGRREVLDRVEAITGTGLDFFQEDVRNREAMARILAHSGCEAVIHFAGLKSVPESITDPLRYYDINLCGTASLLLGMRDAGVRALVFSSSAAVYGEAGSMPVVETDPVNPVSPYGRTKLAAEEMLRDLAASDSGWTSVSLRYFNPVGAHPSGRLGEVTGPGSNNLAPVMARVALGQLPWLNVFGTDHPTPDGTAIRDFIHVMDVASAHVHALRSLASGAGARTYNLGTGTGCSIREIVSAFEKACGRPIPMKFCPRRPGDVSVSYANAERAQVELGWRATRTVADMCRDAWRWHSSNQDVPL